MAKADSYIATKGAHTRNASLGTAVSIAVPTQANVLLIAAETQDVRVTFDGTTPTTTVGFRLYAGRDPFSFFVNSAMTVKVIEVTSGGVVNYQFLEL